MRVAVVHSFYESAQPSGENAQVLAEVEALSAAGLDVRLFAVHTDDLRSERLYQLRSGLRVATGVGRSPLRAIEGFAPDLVHVHNLFPNLGRRWVTRLQVPSVVTLHNFRLHCAKGSLYRDGHLCTECPDGDRWAGARYRCYRDSLAATLPLTIGQRRGPAADPVLATASRILCLSTRQRHMLAEDGVPPSRLVDWANFLPAGRDPGPGSEAGAGGTPDRRDGCLFVGRLSEEKGALDLVSAWDDRMVLRVVGDGPQLAEVTRRAQGRRIEVLGSLSPPAVLEIMARSAALAMPGGWPEGSNTPLVYLEALACGLPVVLRRACDVSGSVERDGTGAVVDDIARMPAAVAAVAADADLPARCRAVHRSRYTARAWVERATDLYRGVLDNGGQARPRPSTSRNAH